jgi:magnesium-transporting ATPase (P-type)
VTGRDLAVVRPMRVILVVAAVLVFLAGLQLTVFPLRTADWFAWTIEVPMTAVFLGAAYWSSAVLEVAGARAGLWSRARLSVWTVLVFTTLTLVVTLVHLDKFHLAAGNPTSARLVTVGWLAVYAVVPVVMVALVWHQARQERRPRRRAAETRARPPVPLRALLVALAVVLLALGVVLLLVPLEGARFWPWPLTELTGRAVGAWLVGLGWASAHARVIDDLPSIRPLGLTGIAFVVLQGLALLRHGDELDWSSPTATGYVVVLAVIGVVAGWILVANRRRAAA